MMRPLLLKGGDYDIARRDDLRSELERGALHSDVLLDLCATDFLDCSCLGVLTSQLEKWRKEDREVRIRLLNVAPSIARMLALLELDQVFVIESIRSRE